VSRRHLRLASGLLIALGVTWTLALAVARDASADPACCQAPRSGLATPSAPCQGLLPLACCEGSSLPSATHERPGPEAAASVPAPAAAPLAAPSLGTAPLLALAPPAAFLLRTVVLRL
jgi:hypothetical protein